MPDMGFLTLIGLPKREAVQRSWQNLPLPSFQCLSRGREGGREAGRRQAHDPPPRWLVNKEADLYLSCGGYLEIQVEKTCNLM